MEIDGLEKRIHAEKERLSRNANAENQPLIDAIEKLQHDVDKLTILLVEARHESMAIEEAMEPIKAEFNEIKEKLNSAQMYAANAKGSLKNLENVTQHPLQAYGQQTSALVQLINNYRRWNEKPIGPIGQFVKLKDQKYADVLESFFTSVLNAFVVTNREDRATLLSFAHKCRAYVSLVGLS
jgi:chromosome segregation ATPase